MEDLVAFNNVDASITKNPKQDFNANKGERKIKTKSRLGMMKAMGLKAYKLTNWDTMSDEDFKFIVDAHKATMKNKKAIKKMLKDEGYKKEIEKKAFADKRKSLIKAEPKRWKLRDGIYVSCKEEEAEHVLTYYVKDPVTGKAVAMKDFVKKRYPFVSTKEKEQVRAFFKDETLYT